MVANSGSRQGSDLAFLIDDPKSASAAYGGLAFLDRIARVLTFRISALVKDGVVGAQANRLQLAGEKSDMIQITLGPRCGGCAALVNKRSTVKQMAEYLETLPEVISRQLSFAIYDQDRTALAWFSASMGKTMYKELPTPVAPARPAPTSDGRLRSDIQLTARGTRPA